MVTPRFRQAACEPCRKSKLACDHTRPACARCSQQNKHRSCIYRSAPFRRKQRTKLSSLEASSSLDRPCEPAVPSTTHARTTSAVADSSPSYPNPGYLGQTSHEVIFSHLGSEHGGCNDPINNHLQQSTTQACSLSCHQSTLIRQTAESLRELLGTFQLSVMGDLVAFWRAKGDNLALAEPFIDSCALFANYAALSDFEGEDWHLELANRLIRNTLSPLTYEHGSSLDSYLAQFLGANTRWETLGILLCSVHRATMDIPYFPSLYITDAEKRAFRSLLMRQLTSILDLCLSLDCLNDLQLVFQYESVIIYSYMNGDQSVHFWRRLGDVISSAFALGYHEDANTRQDIPEFMVTLRRTAYQRIYSTDKNISLFLGRPPRMSKRFCFFHLPDSRPPTPTSSNSTEAHATSHSWDQDMVIGYPAESRWSAVSASIKEDILELMFKPSQPLLSQKASALQRKADAEWNSLPLHFRAYDTVTQNTKSPFERDFLISLRLNSLHISFLLRRLLSHGLTEPDGSLIDVSQQMLEQVVQAMLWRDELANSGTTLCWKVVYYGLPAAGVLVLAMLKGRMPQDQAQLSRPTLLDNLSVLVAEVERGTIVKPEDPNYALLSKATQTIQRVIHSARIGQTLGGADEGSCPTGENPDQAPWFSQPINDFWDFEMSFWEGLADHPFLET